MLYVSREPAYTYNHQIFKIQNKNGVYTRILAQSIDQLEAMLTHYQKVFVYRFDLRCTRYNNTNSELSSFISKLKYWVKAQYNSRLGYIWAREHTATSLCQHYHLAVMINGNKVDTPYKIAKKLKELEANWNGSIGYAKSPYYRVKRNDFASVQKAIYRISYLAKVDTKIRKNATANAYNCSRIKHHPSKKAFDFYNLDYP